ncbi:MAG TPA: hypothetical protein VLF94_08470 [Chlamydiales bacterium]|nr:hypothetical protein [Chlamydiales bacterium]
MKLRALAFSLITTLFAAEPHSGNYGAEVVDSVQTTGLVRLNGTSVANAVQVTGSLITLNAHIGTLDITGEANLTGTIVKNSSTIMGSLQTIRSTFEQSITILTQKAVFTASHLEGITVQQDSGFKGKQVLELKQGSVIHGPVHFESGKGEIVLYPGCKVLGPITGGKIVKKP